MDFNEYQTKAAQTIATDNTAEEELHALHGMVAETAETYEVWNRYWRNLDESDINKLHGALVNELGDIYWMTAEFCTAHGWFMRDVMELTPETNTVEHFTGLVIDVGKLHGMYQKRYQGHEITEEDLKQKVRDILHHLEKICKTLAVPVETVLDTNIRKLEDRYPDGFSVERSLHREEETF